MCIRDSLCPEQVITDYLVKLVEFPEALQVLSFANGRVALVAVRAYAGGLMVGKPIREMSEHLGGSVEARIAAIYRRDHAVPPTGETIIEDGDEMCIRDRLLRGTQLPEESSGGYVVVFDDVTRLVAAQRSAAWGEVARRLAHEIKNPLTPCLLYTSRCV